MIVKEKVQRTAVRKTKFSIAFIGETRKSKGILRNFLCISSTCNFANSRVPENRQTENLGDLGVFQTSGMRQFQILRFAEKVVNPCKSPSKQGKKKAEWRVTIRHQDKKMVADFSNRKTSNTKSAILNDNIERKIWWEIETTLILFQ